MTRKKQEVQLQREIETTEEWEEMLAKEGLWVVDVYQEWCGPCAALVGHFRRLKNELGDNLLHFAIAKADTVDALDMYRGRCEPCFLFYAGGSLVAFVHGANSPVILRTVTEQLATEHKVIDGTLERKEVKDPVIARLEEREKALHDAEEMEREEEDSEENVLDYYGERVNYGDAMVVVGSPYQEKKGFTVALIKPDAVRNGKVEEIIQQMEDSGIEILAQEERKLTEEEAREFYAHLEGEEYFDELVKFMSSGPTFALVLTKGQKGDGIVQEWRDLLGPTMVEEAKEQAPESLRAKYGSDKVSNALHGSDSPETAARELAFFFPDMTPPTIPRPGAQPQLQRTLALIRPDAFRTNRDAIMEKIKEAGFKVAMQKEMTLTKEQAEDFYKEHQDKPYFDELTSRMSSGPLMALGLARDDAVSAWRDVLGPTTNAKEEAPDSLRAQFSVDDASINMLHGSDSIESAQKEIEYFFPMEQTVAAIKPDAFGTKDDIVEKIHEAGFRIAARKETTITKEIAEEFYSEHKDKEYYNDLVDHMCSGPTMFMVLSREDAVSGWREVIGPTDPDQAKTEAPDSLRANFGISILQNAVHGSSTKDHALQSMKKVFGDLEFNPDGTVKESEPTKDDEQQAVEDTTVVGTESEEPAPEFQTDASETKEPAEPETTQETKTEAAQETAQETKPEAAQETAQETPDTTQEAGDTQDDTAKEAAEQVAEQAAAQPDQVGEAEQTKPETGDEAKGADETQQEKSEPEPEPEPESKTDNADGVKEEEVKAGDEQAEAGEKSQEGEAKGDDSSKGGEDDTKGEAASEKKTDSEAKGDETPAAS